MVGVRASQFNQWWVSTVEVIDFVVATESQIISPHGLHQTSECSIHVRHCDKGCAYTPGHLAPIKQRVADGHVPIKGHQSQDVNLNMDQGNEEVTLDQTCGIGNSCLFRKENLKHLRSHIGGEAQIHKG